MNAQISTFVNKTAQTQMDHTCVLVRKDTSPQIQHVLVSQFAKKKACSVLLYILKSKCIKI